jgi:hypothetical protein
VSPSARLTVLLLCFSPSAVPAAESVNEPTGGITALTTGQWGEDLAYLLDGLPGRYARDLPSAHRQALDETSDLLDVKLPDLSPMEIVAGFMQLTAMLRDESTLIWPFQPTLGIQILPVHRLTLVDPQGATYEVDVSAVSFADYARPFFTTPVEDTFFVGEPTGEGPNGVADSRNFTLPNSAAEVYYASRFWPKSTPEDDRRWIAPLERLERPGER